MAPLWGILGLSWAELLILVVLGVGGPLVGALVVVIVLMATRKRREPEDE
jgi:hypothetical protein